MRTRILFTIPNFITAGSGGAMLNIIRGLDPERFEPAVCVSRKGGRLDTEVERLGIPFLEAPFTVPALPYASLLPRAWRAARAFSPYRFHLWHSFHYGDDYTEAVIARLAGVRHWVFTKKNMMWRHRAWYVRSLLASRVAAQNTDMLREFFDSRLFRYKTRLVPRGIDTEKFRPGLEARLGLRSHLEIGSRLLVGCVANLVPVKGLETLIEAAAKCPDIVVVFAGKPLDANYAATLRDQVVRAKLEERVHFLGGVDDIPALLSELDVFCLPTHGEGSPVALLEAMGCGLACLASDSPGTRDAIEHPRNGWLVPPEDPAALAAALDALRDPATRTMLGQAARARIEQQFTLEREVAAHTALYDELVRHGS